MLNARFPSLFDAMPDCPEKRACLYSQGKIICVTLSLDNVTKDKYVVLIDEDDPPLFFIINSKKYGIFNTCCLELSNSNYPFFRNDVSYLNYMKVATTIDFVNGKYPTKKQLIDELLLEPSRVKGPLRVEDAEIILCDIKNLTTDIEPKDKKRIISGLENYINAAREVA